MNPLRVGMGNQDKCGRTSLNKKLLVVPILAALTACSGMDLDGGGIDEGDEFADLVELEQLVTNGTVYNFKAQHSGKCLDVAANGTTNGTNIQQYDCNGTAAQKFKTVSTVSGYFKLVVQNGSAKCVDVSGGSTATGDGVNIHLWTCNGASNQDFRFEASNGQYRIRPRHSNKCVDVASSSTSNGANVRQYSCNGSLAQTWATPTAGSSGGSTTNCAVYAHGSAGPCGWWTYSDCCDPCVYGSTSTCPGAGGGGTTDPGSGGSSTSGIGGVVSSTHFGQMFPNKIAFYTYSAMTSAGSAFSAFVNSSNTTIRKREAAAFLANIFHESAGLQAVREYNTANYCNYCDWSRSYGCPAGQCQYYGRGPMQLSWNFNYKLAGDYIGVNLLSSPDQVATNATIAWKTAMWFWNTQTGPNTITAHTGITCTDSWCGFGQTIKSINGSIECGGKRPDLVDARVKKYKQFCDLLGVSYGNNLYC